MLVLTIVTLALPLALPGMVFAGGFQIPEQSARATGMGGAALGLAGDPTTFHANPAALSFLEGTNFSLGSTIIVPDQRFNGVSPATTQTKMQAQVLFPPNFSLSVSPGAGVGVGVSVNFPYEAGTEWDQDWVGSRLATKSDIRVLMIIPSASMKLSDDLAVGLGVTISTLRLLYEQRIPVSVPNSLQPLPDGFATYQANGNVSYGFQLGFLYNVDKALTIGGSFRSRSNMDLDGGSLSFRNIPAAVLNQYPDGEFFTSIPLAAQIRGGAAFHPFPWATLSGELQYGLWSEFKSATIRFSNPTRSTLSFPQNWNNTLNERFGLELIFMDVSLRAGIRFERSPVPDAVLIPGLPDANATGYSLGFGYQVGEGLRLDFAYLLAHFNDRPVGNSVLPFDATGSGFDGVYIGQTTSVALNVSYFWK
ncbi:MAG TPA: outer membrane protein transport protein [Bacteroidota bacterium]|nr:outer membrane protein transport protein [Bacteroidota bacterium]